MYGSLENLMLFSQKYRNSYVQDKLTVLFRPTLAPRSNDITICRREGGGERGERVTGREFG